jgi:hypothetical protein
MKKVGLAIIVMTAAASSFAQYNENFESGYATSAGGTLLTGQNGWYNPVSGSSDWNAFTYAGNAAGFVTNPGGGNNFISGTSQGGSAFGRTQRDMDFSAGGFWAFSYDIAGKFNGTLPSAQNLASFSLQPSTTNRSFTAVDVWDDVNTALSWSAQYIWFDASGAQQAATTPAAAWGGLSPNHWYRQTTIVNFANNSIVQVNLTDLATNVTNTFAPTGWYLLGGAAPTQAMPTGIRFFAGGALGNTLGIDNINVNPVPEPASMAALGLGVVAFIRRRRK